MNHIVLPEAMDLLRKREFDRVARLIASHPGLIGCEMYGMNLLSFALLNDPTPNFVKFCIDSGVSLDAVGPDGVSCLFLADDDDIRDLLLAAGGSYSEFELGLHEMYRSTNDTANFQRLLLDSPDLVHKRHRSGWTLLHYASNDWLYASMLILLQAGADLFVESRDGRTPIGLMRGTVPPEIADRIPQGAVHGSRREIVHKLVYADNTQSVVDAFAMSDHLARSGGCGGEPWLNVASRYGYIDMMNILIKAGVDAQLTASDDGKSALHEASNRACVDILLREGVSIEFRDLRGATPIFDACRNGRLDVVVALHAAGADYSTIDYYGESPLSGAMAYARDFPEGRSIVRFLRSLEIP